MSHLQPSNDHWWWAWYRGMTQYPSIFAFLVFPLWRWLTMMHGTDTTLHAIVRALNARFSLSLYCSWRLYLVTSRRGSNDQWLGRSLKQAGQMLIVPSATHVSVILPFEGKSSTTPLTVFLACILYFCHLFLSSFSTVSQHVQRGLGWAHPIIGFIAPPGTQVRRLVIFKL